MTKLPILPGILLALTIPLAAQTNRIVSPEAMTNASSPTANSIPWGPFTSQENFVHTIYDDLRGTPRTLRGMAFRPQYTANYGPKSYTVRVTLADAATPSSGISTTFASNFKPSGASTVVFNGTLNWPAFTAAPRAPAPFGAIVTFTTPHAYTGVDPLLQEIYVMTATPLTPTHFFERGPVAPHTAGPVGTGCTATGQTAPLNATGTASATTIANTLANGPASAPAALLYGDTSNMFGSLPLPLNLAIINSPGCFLNINPIVILSATTSATGSATHSLTYTLTPTLSGQRLRTQWAAADGAVLRTSNGLDHATPFGGTGIPWPAARVYAISFGSTPPAIGTSLGVQGLITEWHY